MTSEQVEAVAAKVSEALDRRVRELVAQQLAERERSALNSIALIAQRIDEIERELGELKARMPK